MNGFSTAQKVTLAVLAAIAMLTLLVLMVPRGGEMAFGTGVASIIVFGVLVLIVVGIVANVRMNEKKDG